MRPDTARLTSGGTLCRLPDGDRQGPVVTEDELVEVKKALEATAKIGPPMNADKRRSEASG